MPISDEANYRLKLAKGFLEEAQQDVELEQVNYKHVRLSIERRARD